MIDLPPMNPVTSSNISEVGHDPEANELFVRFSGGGLWRYFDVDAATHGAFVDADSVGRHFAQKIKGKFDGEKLT